MRPHDAQHSGPGDADSVQDPQTRVDLAMALALKRGPGEVGPNRRQQLRVRLPRLRSAPRGHRAQALLLRTRPPRVERAERERSQA